MRPSQWLRNRRVRTYAKWLGASLAGLILLCLPQLSVANTFVVFGPRHYVRATGAPQTVRSLFSVHNPSINYTLEINESSVSSAVVTINGAQIFGPSDFNPHTVALRKQVRLLRENELSVELRGRPGESFVLRIIGIDNVPPQIVASVFPDTTATGWYTSPVTITFNCSDTVSGVEFCTPAVVLSSDGANQQITGTARDKAGNTASTTVRVDIDQTAPVIAISRPAEGEVIYASSVEVVGSVSESLSGLLQFACDGAETHVQDGHFSCSFQLAAGPNTLTLSAMDVAGNISTTHLNVTRVPAPTVQILEPRNLLFVNTSPVTVRGTVSDPEATLTINGISTPNSGGAFTVTVPLVEGRNTLTAVATNPAGLAGTGSVQVTLDTTPPRVTVLSPPEGFVTPEPAISVNGTINDVVIGTVNDAQAEVTVNGLPAEVNNRGFAVSVPLSLGDNLLQIIGRDQVGNSFTTRVTVRRVAATGPSLRVLAGNDQSGPVSQRLPEPLSVRLTDAQGNPIAGQLVIFKVLQNNGVLSNETELGRPALAATTDSQGRAQAWWTLGSRAGAGANRVEVSATGLPYPALFVASGTPSAPASAHADSGHGQTGATGQPLAFPFVAVVTDNGHNRLSGIPVIFSVRSGGGHFGSQNTTTLTTDSDGRASAVLTLGAEPGFDNQVVEARIAGSDSPPAVFSASAKVAGNAADTRITGVVLDNGNNPIPGVTVRLYRAYQGNSSNIPIAIGTPVITNAQGQFLIHPAPVGAFKLIADGATVGSSGTAYPSVEYDIVTVAGNDNTVGSPIYLPALDEVNRLCVTATTGGTLTLPAAPGFSLTVAPGSATFPGGSRTGCITVTPVHGDKVPMVPGFGQQPRFVVTIQPVGTHFNPPAAITLPNVDGLQPRQVTEMYSYDHDLSAFVAIGTGTVSADGALVQSDPGVGVIKAGWHCGGNPNSSGTAATCKECFKCMNGSCTPDPDQFGNPCDGNECKVCDGATGCVNRTDSPSSGAPTISKRKVLPSTDPAIPSDEKYKTMGAVGLESIEVTIDVRCDHGRWRPVLKTLTGKYYRWLREDDANWIEDHRNQGADTTCNQAFSVPCILPNHGKPGGWTSKAGVKAHEDVHESRVEPTLREAAPRIKEAIENFWVPIEESGQPVTRAEARKRLQEKLNDETLKGITRVLWGPKWTEARDRDHGGTTPDSYSITAPAYAAEFEQVKPLFDALCQEYRGNDAGLPADLCKVCRPEYRYTCIQD